METPVEAGEPPGLEMFGTLELVLSSTNATGYKDVYLQRNRKKHPYQAKIYRPWRKDFINLGKFAKAHEAAVEVAMQRLEGIDDFPSPDKSRAENSTLPCPALVLQCLLLLIGVLLGSRVAEKRKLNAATTVEVPTPATLLGFENTPLHLRPMPQLQPCPAGVSARAFATGAVAIALPASAPALQQAANLPAMGRLPDGGLLRGR